MVTNHPSVGGRGVAQFKRLLYTREDVWHLNVPIREDHFVLALILNHYISGKINRSFIFPLQYSVMKNTGTQMKG